MTDNGFTPEQLAQLRAVFREELGDAGLRIDGPDHVDAAREDFRWLRKMRMAVEGTASKVGMAVILAVTSGILYLIVQGFKLFGGK